MVSLLYFLGLGGMISSVIYWCYDFLYDLVYKKIFTTVTVYNVDPVYLWLLKYLTE
jgi:predicted PurR-regulated permease PerM